MPVEEPGPPPAPSEADPAVTVSPRPRARSPWRSGVLVVLLGVAFLAGQATAERLDVVATLATLRGDAADDGEHDGAMVGLLEDVIRTEGVMLTFNEAVGERLEGVREEEARAIIAVAAAAGAGGLEALRPFLVDRDGGPAVTEVRTVYLPHLDSWIDYLTALSEEPALLFSRDDQQPYILLINATADAFRIALEDLLASDPSGRVADLAERILDDGFRSEGPQPTL